MKILLDACVSIRVLEQLNAVGYEVDYSTADRFLCGDFAEI